MTFDGLVGDKWLGSHLGKPAWHLEPHADIKEWKNYVAAPAFVDTRVTASDLKRCSAQQTISDIHKGMGLEPNLVLPHCVVSYPTTEDNARSGFIHVQKLRFCQIEYYYVSWVFRTRACVI